MFKDMIKGFRDFILRGNVIDLAIAVVIGAAFTAVVTAFSKSLIEPVINSVFSLIGVSSDSIGGEVGLPGGQTINIGAMVTAVITFLITAAVVYFFFVAPMNAAKAKLSKEASENDPADIALLKEIRDLLKERAEIDARIVELQANRDSHDSNV